MMGQDDFETAVEELHAAAMREFPEPVDVFEDELAAKLGLRRHPARSDDRWRRERVRFIDAAGYLDP